MHDNFSVHIAGLVDIRLRDHSIPLLPNWHPCSPDLNPIEHLWVRLEELVYECLPDLDTNQNKAEQERSLTEVLPSCWEALEPLLIRSLVQSMPDSIDARIHANGRQTRY
jgi:hypothetical protein